MSSDNQIRLFFDSVTSNLDQDLKDFTPLKRVCDKYQQKPSHVILIAMGVICILTLTGLLQHFFVTLFGMVYPAYMSFKAINEGREDSEKHWLTYWLVFGLVTAFDKLISFVLFFLPGYYLIKIIFFIWMFYPRTNGAAIIYQNLFKPYLIKMKDFTEKKQLF